MTPENTDQITEIPIGMQGVFLKVLLNYIPVIPTHIRQETSFALRPAGFADIAPVEDEPMMGIMPIFFGYYVH
jgi:hypothetical protein